MKHQSSLTMNSTTNFQNLASWLFGIISVAIGIINTFWGNDPGFGVFIFFLSFAYFPPFTARVTRKTGLKIPGFIKFLLGVFILWAALGVGELFDKIDLMVTDLM